jgi:hypothetical protein
MATQPREKGPYLDRPNPNELPLEACLTNQRAKRTSSRTASSRLATATISRIGSKARCGYRRAVAVVAAFGNMPAISAAR